MNTTKTIKVPKDIWAHLRSAQSMLKDAAAFPNYLNHNPTRYFLYIKAWELHLIADAKFSAWANNEPLDPKTLKDHGYKLRESPPVPYIKIVDGKAVETEYASEDQKKELLKLLLFGRDDKSREEIFMRGWWFDTFQRELVWKIDLLEVCLKAVEELEQ